MTTCIYVTSSERSAGKTVISLAIAYSLQQKGLRVGVFKPFSLATDRHEDRSVDGAVLTLKAALNMSEPLELINPIVAESTGDYIKKMLTVKREDLEKKIRESWNSLSSRYDFLIVLGYKSCTHMILGKISEVEIAAMLRCPVLAVVVPSSCDVLGDVTYLRQLCDTYNTRLLGVILNRVKSQIDLEEWSSTLELMGIDLLGVVPEILSLHNPTLRDLVREIGGKVLCCENALETTFQHILVGAMSPELASKYFRAVPDKIVITGGDRADLIMLALETDTKGVILTGGVYPSPRVISEAERRNIPLIVVPYDTYTTTKLVHSLCSRVKPGDKRLDIIRDQVSRYIYVDKILEKIRKG